MAVLHCAVRHLVGRAGVLQGDPSDDRSSLQRHAVPPHSWFRYRETAEARWVKAVNSIVGSLLEFYGRRLFILRHVLVKVGIALSL